MEYGKESDMAYVKEDEHTYKAGERVIGGDTYSVIETEIGKSSKGKTKSSEARLHFLQVGDEHAKVDARFLGADFGAQAGLDGDEDEEGKITGAMVKARATVVEAKAGPLYLHGGAGVSTGAKLENGTIDAKLAGCGLKVGKKIGVSVFDNEISVDALALAGKGWLWGK